MPQYSYVTFIQARQALAARLADPNSIFWTDQEKGLYITEALRTYNALCEIWNTPFIFNATVAQTWYNVATLAGSPRVRTVSDDDLYMMMEHHLLEPASGGLWTGTSQFNIGDLQGALQRRQDEVIQVSGCNITQMPRIPSLPNTRRVIFADSTLEPRRARYVPDSTLGSPLTLTREDTLAWDSFESDHLQQTGTPSSWSVITGPPLAMDVDLAPNVPAEYDVLALVSGPIFAPPRATAVGLPNDWSWLAKWGAMSDLLGRESEATDRPRAEYCRKRYEDGLKIMQEANWLISATINGIPVDTPSVREMDGYSPEWEGDVNAWPGIVTAGMDFLAPCPRGNLGISCVLVGNAPVPVQDNDFLQISRDAYDVILDYAQVLAAFKQGGSEFSETLALEKNFLEFCKMNNQRLAKMGLFPDTIREEGRRQEKVQPR